MPEILDPPEQLPADVRPGVPLDQLAGAGKWAQRFQPSDASFAQRFRHNRDIREYGEALQAEKAAKLEADTKATVAAQNFALRSRALDQKKILDDSMIASRHAKMLADEELLPLKTQGMEQATRTSAALERKRLSDELLKGAVDEQVGDFHARLNQDAMTGDGSPEAEDLAILAASRQFPKAYLHPETKALVNEANKRIAERTKTANTVALTEQKALDREAYSRLTADQKLSYWETTNAAKEEAATLADQRKVAAAALGNTQKVEAATVGDQRKVAAAGLTSENKVAAAATAGQRSTLQKQQALVQRHIEALQGRAQKATTDEEKAQIAKEITDSAAFAGEINTRLGAVGGAQPKQVIQKGVTYSLQPDGSYK